MADGRIASLQINDEVGPFRIIERLGEGGMGSVFLACRADDLDLKVALKTLDFWPPRMMDLFREECKILSGLKHPGIAHIIDAGTTPHGQPWLAMEYIDGYSLDRYLKQRNPNLQERISLFLQICDALSHAHQQMVIHRDLKPANVMVTNDGHIKLLDFGIASALDPTTGEQATVTHLSERMMTPEYASPEQIKGLRLSAASDVYSLGILFYELLVGARPYEVKSRNPLQLAEVINTAPITRPSSRFARPGSVGHLSEDLDTIALKALERDLERRYASVEELATDLRLYQAGHPIKARPATAMYRLRKFMHRNPWQVAFISCLSIVLIGFSFYATWQKQLIEEQYLLTQRERMKAESVVDFMVNLFEGIDPDLATGSNLSALDIIEHGRKQVLNLDHEPGIKRQLQLTMARVYRALGHYDTARELYRETLPITRSPGHRWDDYLELVKTLQLAGQYTESEKVLRLLREHREAVTPIMKARYDHARGRQWHLLGHYPEADKAYQRALLEVPEESPLAVDLQADQAKLLSDWGYYEKAIDTLEQVLATKIAHYGAQHPLLFDTLSSLGTNNVLSGRFDVAEAWFDRAGQTLGDAFEQAHPKRTRLLDAQVNLRFEQGHYEDAETLCRRAIALKQHRLGANHPSVAASYRQLAMVLQRQDAFSTAETMGRKALELTRNLLGENHPDTARCLLLLADILRGQRNFAAAEPYYRRALAVLGTCLGKTHPAYGDALSLMATWFEDNDAYDVAVNLYKESLDIKKNSLGNMHPLYAESLNNLALLYLKMGKYKSAEPYYRQALAIMVTVLGEDHPDTTVILGNLGFLLLEMGDYSQAEPLLERAFTHQNGRKMTSSSAIVLFKWAKLARLQGKTELARKHLLAALSVFQEQADDYWAISTLDEMIYTSLTEANPSLVAHFVRERQNYGEALDHPLFQAAMLHQQARELMHRGQRPLTQLKKAIRLREQVQGPNHPRILTYRLDLAEVLALSGEGDACTEQLCLIRKVSGESLVDGHEYLYIADAIEGLVLLGKGQVAQGKKAIAKAKSSLSERLGPEHYLTQKVSAMTQLFDTTD